MQTFVCYLLRNMIHSVIWGKKGESMLIRIQTQIQKMEEVEVKRKEELQITEDNRNYYADVTFTSKKTAYDYLSLMARKGINVAEDCLSLAYGYSVMVDNAIEYVKSKEYGDYISVKSRETWIQIWKEK